MNASTVDIDAIFRDLGDHMHLTRDKAQRKLEHCLIMARVALKREATTEEDVAKQEQAAKDVATIQEAVLSMLANNGEWEQLQSGFNAAKAVVPLTDKERDIEWLERVVEYVDAYLEHEEVRVRNALCECLLELARTLGVDLLHQMQSRLYESIESNMERVAEVTEEEDVQKLEANKDGTFGTDGPLSGRVSPRGFGVGMSVGAGTSMMHDTEGWKCLETSLKALQSILRGLDTEARGEVDEQMLGLVEISVQHSNRFVREIGHFTCATIAHVVDSDTMESLWKLLAGLIADGLADNWSQVRFSASVAVRELMANLSESAKEAAYELLLPRMCLNRYYVAEGVRVYSQDTWKRVVGMEGRTLVAKYIDATVAYYVESAKADNHAVREAACHCMAELATKIDADAVRAHVPTMLTALLDCFRDASWPVRDAACNATGSFVAACKEESREVLDELYHLWIAHLSDNIWSVRENSAVSLGKVVRAYGDEAMERVGPVLDELLRAVYDQPEDSVSMAGLDNVTQFGVAGSSKAARDNDKALHSDQPMFSCGSLAPKLARGAGCMDHGFTREKEPWESTDGAVYLLREVAANGYADAAMEHIDTLADIADLDMPFVHYPYLLETVWKQLPLLCASLGAERTRLVLPKFVKAYQRAVNCGHNLASSAAEDVVTVLARELPMLSQKEIKERLGLSLRSVFDAE